MNESNSPYITCEDLFKIYKVADLEVVALRGLDLKVDQGEVVAIVGASGSGKSTLLNILAGYDNPSAGNIRVGKRDLLRMNPRDVEEYRKLEVGFIWQQTSRNLFPYLTALENVALPMMLTSVKGAERNERASRLLNIVGLEHRLDHTPEKLSGGEQQRVAIAVGLANNPPLLLADEPTGSLDKKNSVEIFSLLKKQINSNRIIIFATHNRFFANKSDCILEIVDGNIKSINA